MMTVPNNIALEGLDEKTIDRDPIQQFQIWFSDAIAAKLPLPEAMTLATAHFVLAAVNQQTFETVPIPAELREKLAPYNADEDHK